MNHNVKPGKIYIHSYPDLGEGDEIPPFPPLNSLLEGYHWKMAIMGKKDTNDSLFLRALHISDQFG